MHSRAGSVKLDLTAAVISHRVVEIALEMYAASATLVLPRGASVDCAPVESGMVASSTKVRGIPTSVEPAGTPHVVVTGKLRAGGLTVRPQRRFLRWRW